MKIREKLTTDLEINGFTNEEAIGIVHNLTTATTESMSGRWEEDIERYPAMRYLGIWCKCKKIASIFLIGHKDNEMVSLNLLRYKPFQKPTN